MTAEAGIVINHAKIIFFVMPQFTAFWGVAGTHAHDRGSDDLCRADWKSRQVRDGHDKDGCHLRGKRIVNIDLADIHPHSFDHVISAGYGANSQGDRTSENEPQRNYDVSGIKTGKSDGDETHDLLRVVAAITEGEKKAAQLL